jgi:putative multiple sugar transport system ATP-binding protein
VYTLAFGRITGELPVAQATQERLMELMTLERDQPLPTKESAS